MESEPGLRQVATLEVMLIRDRNHNQIFHQFRKLNRGRVIYVK